MSRCNAIRIRPVALAIVAQLEKGALAEIVPGEARRGSFDLVAAKLHLKVPELSVAGGREFCREQVGDPVFLIDAIHPRRHPGAERSILEPPWQVGVRSRGPPLARGHTQREDRIAPFRLPQRLQERPERLDARVLLRQPPGDFAEDHLGEIELGPVQKPAGHPSVEAPGKSSSASRLR